jgi:hypothetical protein
MMKGVLVALIVVILVMFAGCEGMGVTVSYDDQPTKVPTTIATKAGTPTATLTPTPTPLVKITPNVTVTESPEPTEEPTTAEPEITWTPRPTEVVPDIADPKQPYILYADNDFKVQYPSNWSVVKINTNTKRTPYVRDGLLKGDTRLVRFESKQGSVNFTVQSTDFIVTGQYSLDTLIETAYRSVMERFNDVSGYSAVTNYEIRYSPVYQTPYVTFDVTLPESSASYPYAYTERNTAGYSHFTTARFNTMGTLENYSAMKQVMFASLQTDEKVKVV